MKCILAALTIAVCFTAKAQPARYTVANAHAHNDYMHPQPFTTAYGEGFGSIEVDIFLLHDSLLVGHEFADTKLKRTIQNYYLTPLLQKVTANHGFPYADTSRSLQLLIDIKTAPISTIKKLVEVLAGYKALVKQPKIHFVITGNKPADSLLVNYPSFVSFDGELMHDYPARALSRIAMLSSDLENYTKWKGDGVLEEKDKAALYEAISKAHKLHKTVRFWDAPDNENAWKQFMQTGVDYINTDKLHELASFLNNQ